MNHQPELPLDRDNDGERDAAIAQVENNNNPAPNDLALRDMRDRLLRAEPGTSFTSDTLLPNVGQYGFTDNRAVGPLMMRCVKKGWLKPTSMHRNSKRPGNHSVPRRIYLSTIHESEH